MASTSEVGHVKNVANFERLITTVTALGSSYNPAKTQIKLTELNTLLADAQASLAKVIQLNVTYNNAVNARIQLFTPIKKFSTRLIGAHSATDATPETLADAKAIQRKIQGQRPSAHRIINPNPDPNVPTPDPISTSQQSFDQLTEHFNKLIEVLTAEPTYTPNEAGLQITALNTLLADMHHATTEVNTTHVALTNQRISRNKLFYTDPHNLCEIAHDVKSYFLLVGVVPYQSIRSISTFPIGWCSATDHKQGLYKEKEQVIGFSYAPKKCVIDFVRHNLYP